MSHHTALLMIDRQNGCTRQDPRDSLGWPPIWRLSEIVGECAGLLAAAREAGMPGVYSWNAQIMDAVAPKAGDVVLPETRHNFFAWTEWGPVLRSLRVERLIVAGLQTDVCVEATVRAGLEHNFSVAVAEDAVSTDGPDLHFASLNSMRVIYVEVDTWRELIKPNAPWDRAFRTPHYGRTPNTGRIRRSSKVESAALRLGDHRAMSGGGRARRSTKVLPVHCRGTTVHKDQSSAVRRLT